ncbi:uncharacterized protein SCHCODRAFT_02635905 [Schizophyllum commune H4-8]|nr:uncharacterized protein SCHCODRAFT_02635905 [Schizophyllum commune H4-8]KAI5888163.1 hypothetical protein SCHCODRAFT_02635905 [Schizophyllum commune H4-8]
MRLPQELVDAVVAYVQHETGNEIVLNLLQASTTVFLPQICFNLQHEAICLDSYHSYRHLFEITKLCPAVLPCIWHLRVNADARLLDGFLSALPAVLLNDCTCLRSLHVSVTGRSIEWTMLPISYRAALYKCMQLPTLEKLQLQSITVTPAAVEEFTAPSLPPHLKTISISRIWMVSGTYFSTQPTMARLGCTSATTTFSCDHQSLPFARLLYNPRPYPFGDLHELELASDDAGVDSAAQQILAENPRLAHLTCQCSSSFLPAYNLRENIALRTLTLRFRIPVETWAPVGFPEVLKSIPGSGTRTLESFSLFVSTEETAIDYWRAVDEALCRFEMLKTVELHLKNPFAGRDATSIPVQQEETASGRFPGLWDAMGRTHERGILKIITGW